MTDADSARWRRVMTRADRYLIAIILWVAALVVALPVTRSWAPWSYGYVTHALAGALGAILWQVCRDVASLLRRRSRKNANV